MKKFSFLLVITILLLGVSSAFAYNFKCLSRNGWAPGNGRYSYQGEWVDYFKVYAKAGGYVLFYYPKGKKGYWFPRNKCYEI